jgi:hypothetical protein
MYSSIGQGATNLIFNHAGDGILAVHTSKPSIGIFELPSVRHIDWVSAHPRGCAALTLDPRGRLGCFHSPLDRQFLTFSSLDMLPRAVMTRLSTFSRRMNGYVHAQLPLASELLSGLGNNFPKHH